MMFGKNTILADLRLLGPMPKAGAATELELQVRLCKILGIAFAFSLMGLSGLGSLIALTLGLRAIYIIKRHQGRVGGVLLAWWCIIVGALGILSGPATIIQNFWKYL